LGRAVLYGTFFRVNVVFISPNFPPQFYLFIEALKRHGATVLGIGDCPPHVLSHPLRHALSDYAQVFGSAYEDYYRAMAHLSARHGPIDRVESLNEHWLLWESMLRDDFNVYGPRRAEMVRSRSKSGMREVFRSAGVVCTEGEKVVSAEQVRAFARVHGFPLVFKPDTGVGAARTFKVSDDSELSSALGQSLEGYVVERFSSGALVSFDGLTGKDGEILYCTSHVYSSGVMEMVNEGKDVFYFSRRAIPEKLEQAGRKVVRAFGLRERFFHIEFFEEGSGVRALEINLRPPGGFTTDMMNYGSDIDIYDLWARVVCNRDTSSFSYERKYFCGYISRRQGRHYRIPHDEVVRRLGPRLILSGEMPGVWAGAMGNYMYLLRHPDEEGISNAISLVHALG
jgi:hypothetical protein